MNIGFIGLGVMGRPMAEHLIAAGHTVHLNRVKPVSEYLIDKGGTALDSARAVAEASEVIILMVPDTPTSRRCCSGRRALQRGLARASSSST